MYEENENKIDWGSIIKKVSIVVVSILILLGFISLVTKYAKKPETDKPKEEKVDLTDQLNELEAATLKYLTKENLPVELNSSKTIRLKILVNKELLQGITDSQNNKCDINESYSEVTRLENNYAVKMSLTCGKNKDYRIIYVGCFENCNGGVCKGTENSTGGVCNEITDNKDKNNTQTQNKPSNTTTKPNNNSNTNTTKPNNNNSNNSNVNNNTNNNTNNTKPKVYEYEFKKCTTSCQEGTLNTSTNKCEVNTSTYPVITNVSYKNSSLANKKDPRIGYEFKNYLNGSYNYTKYECSSDYTFNYRTKKCDALAREPITKCETTWSTSTSLNGWTATGNVR